MSKISYLFKRIKNMSYKGFFDTIDSEHRKYNANRVYLFFDIIRCGIIYQAGYSDYKLFEMYKMNHKERKTIITRGKNNSLFKKFNNKEYIKIFNDKTLFNKKYDKYLNRDWLVLKDNYDEFNNFIKNKDEIIVKPVNLFCGQGIEKIDLTKEKTKELYERLIKNKQLLIEEVAKQHRVIDKIYPYSINTLRVVTLNHHVVNAFIRIGNLYNVVDNFNHGGLAAKIDIKTGEIISNAVDKKGDIYYTHPITNERIEGVKIPMWDEVLNLCLEASKVTKELGYVGWDVCVGHDKPFLIEANEFPGNDIYQLPVHRKDNYGDLPIFIEAAKGTLKK